MEISGPDSEYTEAGPLACFRDRWTGIKPEAAFSEITGCSPGTIAAETAWQYRTLYLRRSTTV